MNETEMRSRLEEAMQKHDHHWWNDFAGPGGAFVCECGEKFFESGIDPVTGRTRFAIALWNHRVDTVLAAIEETRVSSEPRACEHMTLTDLQARSESMVGVAMAAPGRTCPCCRGWYYYIDSGSVQFSSGGVVRTQTRTHSNNCNDCGGEYVEYDSAAP